MCAVQSGLLLAVYFACLLLVVIGVVAYLRNRTTGLVALAATAATELLVLAQVVWAAVKLVQGTRPAEQATFIGYLAGILFVLPVAVFWSLAERSRWNGVVLAVASLTVAVMAARLQMMWRTAGG
ncbi:MAG TPA: hypothetical protein VFP72_21255 [Kineosporiaceae bacterium]|nr:hypothetical protein [Kineosporiaceae bacterium]